MKRHRWLMVCYALLGPALLLATGCSPPPGTGPGKTVKADADDHPTKGPHGGVIGEAADHEYHAEFLVDHSKKQATVYILDRRAKKAAPIAEQSITLTLTNFTPPLQITLKADPQEKDPKGKASRFTGTHEKLGEEIDFKGEINGMVGDKPYTWEFNEAEHDHKNKD